MDIRPRLIRQIKAGQIKAGQQLLVAVKDEEDEQPKKKAKKA